MSAVEEHSSTTSQGETVTPAAAPQWTRAGQRDNSQPPAPDSSPGRRPAAAKISGKHRLRRKGEFQTKARMRAQMRRHFAGKMEPGDRGWAGRGGGRTPWVEAAKEWIGTSVQVCGLWPWAGGSGSPMVGTPLGRHLHYQTPVCGDPISWFLAGYLNAPTGFLLGEPGLGKSSLMRRIVSVVPNWGIVPIVLSDTRPDFVGVISSLGGQVLHIGRGLQHINPLDPGPMVQYLHLLDDAKLRECLAIIHSNRLNLISALVELVRDGKLEEEEKSILSACLHILDEEHVDPAHNNVPVMSDILDLIRDRHPVLRRLVNDRDDEERYDARTEALQRALVAVGGATVEGLSDEHVTGGFGDTFARHTDEAIDLTRPVCVDISSIDGMDARFQAAVQLTTWSYGAGTLAAAKFLGDAGALPYRFTYLMVIDELYRSLKALPLMVRRVDDLVRMIRKMMLGLLLCTHTMGDLKFADDELTETAWGLVERSDMVVLGGLSRREMGYLTTVWDMSDEEQDLVTGWSDKGVLGGSNSKGKRRIPKGRGKFLIKTGGSAGIPFQMLLTQEELLVGDTNRDWNQLRDARLAS